MTEFTVRDAIQNASRNQPPNKLVSSDGLRDVTVPFMGSTAASSTQLRFADLIPNQPPPVSGDAVQDLRVVNRPAGEQYSLQASILKRSLVAQMGTHIVPIDYQGPLNETMIIRRHPAEFRLHRPIDFQVADDLNPLVAAPLPITTEGVVRDAMIMRGTQISLPRSVLKSTDKNVLDAEIAQGITGGIIRLVDQVMLERMSTDLVAMAATSTLPDVLAALAPTGIRFEELRAIAGSAANGISGVDESGGLRVQGIPGQMTGSHTSTFIGAFDRSAIAILDDIQVIASRMDAAGSLELTVWIHMAPLLPDPGYFVELA